jgi:hypothetical protein
MYNPARREAETIPFPSSGKTNKVFAPNAQPWDRKCAGGRSAGFLFLRRKKTRSADLFVFVFLFAWGGWKNIEKLH